MTKSNLKKLTLFVAVAVGWCAENQLYLAISFVSSRRKYILLSESSTACLVICSDLQKLCTPETHTDALKNLLSRSK
jgi:hypothetical protein